jgi:excinuclease UvrABC nuclease subunit
MNLDCSVPLPAESLDAADFETFPAAPAVFALFPREAQGAPYLARTADLRRRLRRLLARPGALSKVLNLREIAGRIEYQPVGSSLEASWLLYRLNRAYYPRQYRQRLRLRPPPLLKVNLRNRFPRCYPTRRMVRDGSLYYGPFPSRGAAERFAAEFLDLFLIRRCVEELSPDPSHPGCIYSQMKMCLAPCFAGCTDDEYQAEVGRVVSFLAADGRPLLRELQSQREEASESLAFEEAARVHRRIEKVQEVLRLKPDLARDLHELHGIIVLRGAAPKTVNFLRIVAGEMRGPVTLSLDENAPSPVPLDQQLHALLDPLGTAPSDGEPPSWEHLSLLARWYYSSFREGELLMLAPSQEIPHARLIRLCRKVLAGDEKEPKETRERQAPHREAPGPVL